MNGTYKLGFPGVRQGVDTVDFEIDGGSVKGLAESRKGKVNVYFLLNYFGVVDLTESRSHLCFI